MTRIKRGDILKADAEALVNTVNCVGVMGRGIALQFREAYPENHKAYKALCVRGGMKLGHVFVFDLSRFENPRFVINFPTKNHWKCKSRLQDIAAGLRDLVSVLRSLRIRSVAIPPLGCGLGGLDWNEVRPLICNALKDVPDIEVLLYEPAGAPAAESMIHRKDTPKMTPGRAALIGLIRRYLAGLMDSTVTLLEVQKLMYFMQEAGEDLKLEFAKATYGPYARNLRHVLIAVEGRYLSGYGDAVDSPTREVRLVPGAAAEAEAFLREQVATVEHFDRVGDLIEGFETSYAMELLSTVHWVARREGAHSPDEAKVKTYAWSKRKQMFTAKQIEVAFDVLQDKGWLSAPSPGPLLV